MVRIKMGRRPGLSQKKGIKTVKNRADKNGGFLVI